MKTDDLSRIGEAPEQGYFLVYTRKYADFGRYETKEDVVNRGKEEELLELHLFNADKEYRAVSTESPRFPLGVIEAISDFSDTEEGCFHEQILLDGESEGESGDMTVKVLNHISYDERGMAFVDDYRLVPGGER